MKIYCLTCREYILETSDAFVIGGSYNGAMFKGATGDRWAASLFRTVESVKGGDLYCPRCMGPFIVDGGKLLTEHGVIQPGQKSIDTSFNIVHQEGHAKGMLMYVKDSFLATEDWDIMRAKKASYICTNCKKEFPTTYPDPNIARDEWKEHTEGCGIDELLKCSKCGKEYKDKMWFDKHVERCGG